MATYNKFNVFTKDVTEGKHDFSAHAFKFMLTNTAPSATNAVKTDITEISAGNGYTAGGTATTVSKTSSSGTETVKGTNVTITASGGNIGPFRYVVLYNDTQTSPAKPLIAWWDYGASITLLDGEPLLIDTAGDVTDNLFTLV